MLLHKTRFPRHDFASELPPRPPSPIHEGLRRVQPILDRRSGPRIRGHHQDDHVHTPAPRACTGLAKAPISCSTRSWRAVENAAPHDSGDVHRSLRRFSSVRVPTVRHRVLETSDKLPASQFLTSMSSCKVWGGIRRPRGAYAPRNSILIALKAESMMMELKVLSRHTSNRSTPLK